MTLTQVTVDLILFTNDEEMVQLRHFRYTCANAIRQHWVSSKLDTLEPFKTLLTPRLGSKQLKWPKIHLEKIVP